MSVPLLSIVGLETRFFTPAGVVHAARKVTFDIAAGEIVAVVGESGSGKSVTAMSAMRLIQSPPGEIVAGKVLLDGEDILTMSKEQLRSVRGRRISMIFQNPQAALNPLLTIGDQLVETLNLYTSTSRAEGRDIAADSLARLDIKDPRRILDSMPFEASGGTNQRVMLALALMGQPELLIADEPTTMLDAISQKEIFLLLLRIQRERGMAIWLITHDFGVVEMMADQVVVMYAGSPVESGPVAEILANPKHPYTVGLMRSVPELRSKQRRLEQIPGAPPDLRVVAPGCSFAPRCEFATTICLKQAPPEVVATGGARVKCWRYAPEEEQL